jgi:WD40 repeat protein
VRPVGWDGNPTSPISEGKRLASVDAFGTVKVWDAQGQLLHSFVGHPAGDNQLAFSPDGKWLATASLDGTVRLWDVTPPGKGVRVLDFLPRHRRAAAVCGWPSARKAATWSSAWPTA